MENIIVKLEELGKILFDKYGTESYTERCIIHDLKTEIKALILPVVMQQSEQLFCHTCNKPLPENERGNCCSKCWKKKYGAK